MNPIVMLCNAGVVITLLTANPDPAYKVTILALALVLNLFELKRIANRV